MIAICEMAGSSPLAERIVRAARGLVGVRFVHQGRDPAIGLDCVGVAIGAARACGLSVLDREGYGRAPGDDHAQTGLIAVIAAQPCLRRVQRPPAAGDLLIMQFARVPHHVAICGGDTVIHALGSIGRCVEHPIDATWRRRIVGVAEFVERGALALGAA